MCLHALGLTAYFARHLGEARSRWEESLRLARELGETRGVATDLAALGGLARHEGRYAEAQELLDQSLQLFREVGDTQGMARSLMMLGYVVVEQGRCDEARALDAEGLRLSREIGDARGVVFALDLFGVIAGSMQQHERSTILIFAVRRLLTSMGAAPEPGDQDRTDRVLAAAEAALGLNAYQAFRERGEAMSLEEAVTYALGENA
jgi:tetratricopeptide (TPR) repeat protein